MSSSKISSSLNRSHKAAYWRVVRDCVVRFHGETQTSAIKKVRELRKRLDAPESEGAGEIIYHDEPFYVACDVAGMHEIPDQETLLQQHRKSYRSILEASGW